MSPLPVMTNHNEIFSPHSLNYDSDPIIQNLLFQLTNNHPRYVKENPFKSFYLFILFFSFIVGLLKKITA